MSISQCPLSHHCVLSVTLINERLVRCAYLFSNIHLVKTFKVWNSLCLTNKNSPYTFLLMKTSQRNKTKVDAHEDIHHS